jgi:hypothetical protein
MLIFRGHQADRWGRDGVPRTADWRWWNPPPMNTLATGDQDADGYPDIFLINNDFPSHLSILYGTAGALPDTTAVETADLASIGARTSHFLDVTGDHIPELVVTNDVRSVLRVYLGLRGQRLSEQFGSGHDAPQPGQKQWWGKPWAEIWEPAKISSQWPGPYDLLYDLGDVNLDGIGDIASYNAPWMTVYCGGSLLDSLIDAMVDTRAIGGTLDDTHPGAVAVLGDIDGSHVPTIAIGEQGILFVKPSRDVPQTGIYREIPTEAGPASVAETTSGHGDQNEPLHLEAIPNPASGEVRLQWSGEDLQGSALVSITDAAGHELKRIGMAATERTLLLTTDGYAKGEYFITLTIGQRSATTRLVVQS